MAGFFNAISAVLLLFSLMSVGFGMGKLGWMQQREKTFLSRFVINIGVPCNTIAGLLNNFKREQLVQAMGLIAVAICTILCMLALAALIANALKLPRQRWGVFVSMVGTSNTLFVGLPLTTQLFGETSIPYMMMYYLSSTLFSQTLLVYLVEHAGSAPKTAGFHPVGVARDLLSKPPVLGIVASVAMLALDVRPPALVMRFLGYLSDTVVPLALIYCGYILYEVGIKNLRFLTGLPIMLVLRLFVAPTVCALLCSAAGVTGLIRSVFIVEAALPVMSQIPVMAGAYGADEQYAAMGASLSMLGCFFTIPILMLILG